MAKFPEPPSIADLRALGATKITIPAGTVLWRVHFAGGPYSSEWDTFRTFGPTDSRFDHHIPPPHVQIRGILYAAKEGPTCLAEVFQATRTIDRTHHDPRLVQFRLRRGVVLLDMTGTWVTRAGASTAIHSGSRSRARRWSIAVYNAYPSIEGIAYCSSMNANRPAYALYERAATALPAKPTYNRALNDAALLPYIEAAAHRFLYAVV